MLYYSILIIVILLIICFLNDVITIESIFKFIGLFVIAVFLRKYCHNVKNIISGGTYQEENWEKCYKKDYDRLKLLANSNENHIINSDIIIKDYRNMYCTNIHLLRNYIEKANITLDSDLKEYSPVLKLYSHILRNQIPEDGYETYNIDDQYQLKLNYKNIYKFLYYTENTTQQVKNILEGSGVIAKPIVNYSRKFLPNLLHYLADVENVKIYLDIDADESLKELWSKVICNTNCKYINIKHGDYEAPSLKQIKIFNNTMDNCVIEKSNAVFTCYSGHGRSGFMALTYLCKKNSNYIPVFLKQLFNMVFTYFKYKNINRERFNYHFQHTQLYKILTRGYHHEAAHEIFNDFTNENNTFLFFKRIKLLIEFIYGEKADETYNNIMIKVNDDLLKNKQDNYTELFKKDIYDEKDTEYMKANNYCIFKFNPFVDPNLIYKTIKINNNNNDETNIRITASNNPYFIKTNEANSSHTNADRLLNQTQPNLLIILTSLQNYKNMPGYRLVEKINKDIEIFTLPSGQLKYSFFHCIYFNWPDGNIDENFLYPNLIILCSFIIKFINFNIKNITIHCNSGSGRTGTVLTILKLYYDLFTKKKDNQFYLINEIIKLREETGNNYLVESIEQCDLIKKIITFLDTFEPYFKNPDDHVS